MAYNVLASPSSTSVEVSGVEVEEISSGDTSAVVGGSFVSGASEK